MQWKLCEKILSSDVPLTIVPNCCINEYCFVTDLYPEVKENIAEIVMMGGSLAREIQIQVPNLIRMSIHTLHKLFSNQVSHLTMVGLDVTSQAVLTNHEVTAIRALGRVGNVLWSFPSL